MQRTIRSLRSAFGFLTRLPVGAWPLQKDLDGVSMWLPLVGAVVGGLAGAVSWAAWAVFAPCPLLLPGIIGCAAWAMVTGGLHLDGVADCGDGLPAEVSRERRLEIMKDSRLGTFGGIFLFFCLMLKAAAIGTLFLRAAGGWRFMALCALAGLLGRVQIFAAMRMPGARKGGMGEAFCRATRTRHAVAALGVTLVCCALAGLPGLRALLWAALASACVLCYARRRLGGVTGDVFGLSVETTECAALLSFCLSPA